MRYRVEQLAAACDVSVDTVRYYQTRGLVPPPAREGRVAWYDDRHAERIREVRELRRRGLTLAAIERVLGDGLDPADADLAVAIAAARGEAQQDELLSLDGFASRSGVPASLILTATMTARRQPDGRLKAAASITAWAPGRASLASVPAFADYLKKHRQPVGLMASLKSVQARSPSKRERK